MRLASANTLLHAASLTWFPEVVLTELPTQQEDVERLAVWLAARRGGCARLPPRQQCAAPLAFFALKCCLAFATTADVQSPAQSSQMCRLPACAARTHIKHTQGHNLAAEHICRALAVLAGHSVNIASLDLSYCSLEGVPPALSHLTGLSRLSLHSNSLRGGWQHLLPLQQQLRELDLRFCHLAEVPRALSALTALTWLDLAYNWQLQGGWQHLQPLRQLQHLNLSDCNLAEVPPALAHLTNLTNLRMSNNQRLAMMGGWQHLRPLRQLQHLNLCSCNLAEVPPALSHLTALSSLRLAGNPLGGGWQHLRPLRQLRTLDVEQCSLAMVPLSFQSWGQ